MEVIVGLLVLGAAIWWIFFRDMDKETKSSLVTPQKDEIKEAPVVDPAPVAPAPVVEVVVAPVAEEPKKAPAKKPAAKKTAGAKPAAAKKAKTTSKPAARTAKPKKA